MNPRKGRTWSGCKPRLRARAASFLALVLVAGSSACAPEGAGSIHVDKARVSGVSIVPDRKESPPARAKARPGRINVGTNRPRR
jgi:hypothetical protein